MRPSSGDEPLQFAGLDILRFASAMMVMSYHLGFWCFVERRSDIGTSHGAFGATLDGAPLLPFSRYGWVGVPLFFVISGFVIARSADGASLSGFVKSRALRLLPAAWICATITASLLLLAGLYDPAVVLRAYAHALFFYPFEPWIDGVYWTLPIEISFYAVVSLFLLTKSMDRLESVFIAIGAASSSAWLLHYSLHHSPSLYAALGLDASRLRSSVDGLLADRLSELGLLTYGCYFATGIILFAAVRRGCTFLRIAALVFITGGGLATIVNAAHLTETVSVPAAPAIGAYLFGLAFIVLSVKFDRFLPHRHMREIGLTTYPLYLLHNVPGVLLFGHVLLPRMPAQAASVAAALVSLLVAAFVVRPLERRLRQRLRKALDFERRRRGSTVSPASWRDGVLPDRLWPRQSE